MNTNEDEVRPFTREQIRDAYAAQTSDLLHSVTVAGFLEVLAAEYRRHPDLVAVRPHIKVNAADHTQCDIEIHVTAGLAGLRRLAAVLDLSEPAFDHTVGAPFADPPWDNWTAAGEVVGARVQAWCRVDQEPAL